MDRIYFTTFKGKRVLIQDVSDLHPGREFKKTIEKAKKMISAEPHKSVLSVFDASNCSFSDESVNLMNEFVVGNTPYIKIAAVVGADGLLQMVLTSLVKKSGRDIPSFKTREEALEFLASYDE